MDATFTIGTATFDKVVAPSGAILWLPDEDTQMIDGVKYARLSRGMAEGKWLRKWLTNQQAHSPKVSAIIDELQQWVRTATHEALHCSDAFSDPVEEGGARPKSGEKVQLTLFSAWHRRKEGRSFAKLVDSEDGQLVDVTLPGFAISESTCIDAVSVRVPAIKLASAEVFLPLEVEPMGWLFNRAQLDDDELSTPIKRLRRDIQAPCHGSYYHTTKKGFACSKKGANGLKYKFITCDIDNSMSMSAAADEARHWCGSTDGDEEDD